MIIGLDWFNTITKEPEVFALMTGMLKKHGDTIYIISAVRQKEYDERAAERYHDKVASDLAEANIAYDELIVVEFEDPKQVPYLKLEECKRLKVEYFFDDRSDVCFVLGENGIITAKV